MFNWLWRLFSFTPPPPDPLDLLASPVPATREAAREELRGKGKEALPVLLAGLAGPREDVAVVSAELLGELGGEEAVGPLLRALKYAARKTQIAARRALERCGGVAVPALREAIGEQNPWVRGQVVEALAAILKAEAERPAEHHPALDPAP